jgi:tetratricopeptide (TPR) repeat protein
MKWKLGAAQLVWLALLLSAPCFAQQSGTDQLIQFYQHRASVDPDNYTSFDRLGSAYLQKARESGDPTYYELSEKAYAQALSLLPAGKSESAPTTGHLAALYLSEHRFAEALTLARESLALDPQLLSAYATLGDAELETGQYAEAASSYAHLDLPANSLPPRPGLAYLAETRHANLCYIQGKPQEAVGHMQAAIAKAIEANLPKENLAWSQFSLGELYFGMGDLARAEENYQAALQTYPDYHRANAWLGQLRAAQERYADAAALYRKAIGVIPLPAYVGALGDIEAKLGHVDEAQKEYSVVDFIAKLSALNQKLFRRELASFYADHDLRLPEALADAQAEVAQRQDVYTWDVLAWASFKNGKIAEATDAIAHALAQNTKDPLLFFHAGMIYRSAGDSAKAKDFFGKALAIHPRFHVFYAEAAAQALAALNEQFSGTEPRVNAVAH